MQSNGAGEPYSFIDNSGAGDIIYYRIKMIDDAERQKLSKTIRVRARLQVWSIITIPNPFYDQLSLTLNVEKTGGLTMQLLDNTGRGGTQKTMYSDRRNSEINDRCYG